MRMSIDRFQPQLDSLSMLSINKKTYEHKEVHAAAY